MPNSSWHLPRHQKEPLVPPQSKAIANARVALSAVPLVSGTREAVSVHRGGEALPRATMPFVSLTQSAPLVTAHCSRWTLWLTCQMVNDWGNHSRQGDDVPAESKD